MRVRTLVALVVTAATFICVARAHPGRTDSKGGHYNRSTGEYHYHHGYSAHQHTNGECPYNFDDKTGWNSGSSLPSSSTETGTVDKPVTPDEYTPSEGGIGGLLTLLSAIGLAGLCIFIALDGRPKRDKPAAFRKKAVSEINEDQGISQVHRFTFDKQQFQEEKARYIAEFAGKTTLELAGTPEGCAMGTDRLPKETDDAHWGAAFTFYVTANGKAYHCVRGCSGATQRIHAYYCAGRRRPCRRCKPVLPDMSWCPRYWEIETIKSKYGIPDYIPPEPKPEESYTAQVPDFTGLLDSWLAQAKLQQDDRNDTKRGN